MADALALAGTLEMSDLLTLLAGFGLLIVGGELLVRGAVAVAERLGMSPLLIGLTLVGLGTSTPELVTSVQASMSGSPGIAIGNFVGSNIANILLVLGLSAAITPIRVGSSALRRDGGMVFSVALLFVLISFFSPLDRIVGAGFLVLIAIYLWFAYLQERTSTSGGHGAAYSVAEASETVRSGPLHHTEARNGLAQRLGAFMPLLIALAGLGIIILGGKLLVDGAVALARGAGVSESVIGLTIVAIGTSAPEFVTSMVAAIRRQGDVALGNITGSCVYNILFIGGVVGVLSPTSVPPEIVSFDNLVMLAASAAMVVFAATGMQVRRHEGMLLFAGYIAYLWALWPK